jgi:hypothetical protein
MKRGRQGEGGGTPLTVITTEQLEQIEKLASVLSKQQIADFLGVGRTTFYEIEKRQPEVAEHYNRGKSKAIGTVAQGLLQKAQSGDTQSSIFYLKTQGRWNDSAIKLKENKLDKLDNKARLELIIDSIMDSPDGEIDTKVLASLDRLIKTKTEIDEIAEIKERLEKLELNG